jgi:tetratricopeptide (TPR) repeat protein
LHGASTTLSNAGRLALRQGAYEQARQLLTESLHLKRALNDGRGEGVALAGLGAVSTRLGEYERAWGELHEALQLARQSGDDKLAVEVLLPLAAYYGEQGELARAGQLLAFVQGHQAAVAEIREEAAQLAEQLGAGAAVAPAVDLAALVAELMA